MSEGDVSLIRDEDVLRRMWQQTEDFSRKKEIRAHMYRLREERLRNLYSPEPTQGKGCEFSSTQGHVQSFADQTFQSMKSKEVRDAGSPPKEFTYRGQDLKELSNAGWNVESEKKTTDDGHTHVKSVRADIEGRYDVEGGRGQFAAVDQHRQAVTEYQDENSSLKRNESSSNTAAREQVVQQTDDGTKISSTTTSSTSSSKFQQMSSTKHETVPYLTTDDYDRQDTTYDTNSNQEFKRSQVNQTKEFEQNLRRSDVETGELVSRKIDYPDDNTKIVVETRCLPDGTRVTSTRKEFRGTPVVQKYSEQQSHQSRNETKSSYTSTHKSSDIRESSTKLIHDSKESRSTDIVDNQKHMDSLDFKRNKAEYVVTEDSQKDQYENISQKRTDQNYNERREKETFQHDQQAETTTNFIKNKENEIQSQQDILKSDHVTDSTEKFHRINTERNVDESVEQNISSDQYQTTYQSDFTQKNKISNDWSPTQQAWASSLRADTPTTTRPSTRASSPGGRTYQSSTSSLRSSVSPDKYRKPSSRGNSPSKIDRYSPTRSTYSSTHSTQSVTSTKTNRHISPQGRAPPSDSTHQRSSASPEKRPYDSPRYSVSPERKAPNYQSPTENVLHHTAPKDKTPTRFNTSPERKPFHKTSPVNTFPKATTPNRSGDPRPSQSPERKYPSEDSPVNKSKELHNRPSPDKTPRKSDDFQESLPKRLTDNNKTVRTPSPEKSVNHKPKSSQEPKTATTEENTILDKIPGYMKPTGVDKHISTKSPSPDRKVNKSTKVTEDHYKFIDEETKVYTKTRKQTTEKSSRDSPDHCRASSPFSESPTRSTLRKASRSPSPPKGPVTFTQDNLASKAVTSTSKADSKYTEDITRQTNIKDSPNSNKKYTPVRETSPTKFGTYDKKHRRSEEEDLETITDDIRYDSLSRREKSVSTRKSPSLPSSPTKKSPRVSSSPTKSSKDSKYSQTLDFIANEKTSENINKSYKDRPRQLVTPSTSPTRKPKNIESAPSTGLSSPTTSVSGFVYFSSPRYESSELVTDLDEHEYHSEIDNTDENTNVFKRPVSLDIKRSPSPSKIPCRSSPQEKSPACSLPRKSSLKKPTQNSNQISPIEKPPSSFRISPTVETKDFSEHKVVKKDNPEKVDTPTKVKPPLERRETYDERCRKILGMIDDATTTSKSIKTETLVKEKVSIPSSPSISPCRSPKEELSNTVIKKNKDIKIKDESAIKFVAESVTGESEYSVNRTDIVTKKSKTPSREQSPTKLDDITYSRNVTQNVSTTSDIDDASTKTISNTFNIISTKNTAAKSPTRLSPEKRLSQSPDRKPVTNKSSQPDMKSPSASETINQVKGYPVQPTSDTKHINISNHSHNLTPTMIKTSITEISTDFLMSEREQEILDKVQKSLRKLSPDRSEKSPSRERSPSKTTTCLQDLDITTSIDEEALTSDTNEKKNTDEKTRIEEKSKLNQKSPSKPASRNVSPIKKCPTTPKAEQSPSSPTKPRSTSPTKPRSSSPKKLASTDRPQSPHTQKASGIKPREPIPSHLTRKPTPSALSPTKVEKNVITTDTKKIVKQNSLTKINTSKYTSNKSTQSTTKSSEPEVRRPTVTKGGKESIPKKSTESHVTRTPSDSSIKPNKHSPQRMRSKPEIQVNDISTSKKHMSTTTTTTKYQKSSTKEPQLTSKPKSVSALNTSTDDDDIIIDVQQAKSSRENSPDRICPTPVGFMEDIGTPRLPDEVSEPDDEFIKRTHQTIHEAESIVDDIVEICEDDELFVKQNNVDLVTGSDECFLSVNDKVSKFTNKVDSIKKPKSTTSQFKDTEKRVHSDFVSENLKSDECLLSVSEKVNKFAKGPRDVKESKSPSRRIVDEYDTETVYQDDYTKLSVNDKAHLFVETAENAKVTKVKPGQKVERPDLTNVDESLKSDDCLLSVSDKVNKFVKTAEQFLGETINDEEKERKIREQHDKIMKKIVNSDNDTTESIKVTSHKTDKIDNSLKNRKSLDRHEDTLTNFAKETASSHAKSNDVINPNIKQTERTPTVKITTLRSSEAVKKAKALFENIASTTQQKTKDATTLKTTKLTDIGVLKKSPKTDSTVVLPASSEDVSPNVTDIDSEVDGVAHRSHHTGRHSSTTPNRLHPHRNEEISRSPHRLTPKPTGISRTVSPMRHVETIATSKTVLSRYPSSPRGESPNPTKDLNDATEKTQDRIPGYQRPTKTSQSKEETKFVEETEVSSRRGSGKFGVELRRTSVERSTVSSERRRSVEHPCIEDIFDLDLLEQMLEKVVGYEQRRRIRAQIRVAKKKLEEQTETNIQNRSTKQSSVTITKTRSSENRSPERKPKTISQKTLSPQRHTKITLQKPNDYSDRLESSVKPMTNGHSKETIVRLTEKHHRPISPEKLAPKMPASRKTPIRQPSPEKKTRPLSPSKVACPKPKQNRFNEYASAYMKKVGLNDSDKLKFSEIKTKKTTDIGEQKTMNRVIEESKTSQTKSTTATTHNKTERMSSRDTIEIVTNGKRTPSPDKKRSPERRHETQTELRQRSPSPILRRQKSDATKKETIIKTAYDIEKKIQSKSTQEEKPSWVTNRNLKKINSETRTFSNKKIEAEKPKYRAPSPSKIISKPLDVITSSYGPGPLDADGRPLFGIKALRNGASNYQVKGTVIRQEYHSRNGGEPEGSVSVTAYSSSPEELERLLASQGERPSRLHGLAAITTTKKFGGDTGTSYKEVHTKEERAALDQFTHHDRRVNSRVESERGQERQANTRVQERQADTRGLMEKEERTERRREDRKTVRQSSVKSLTEKYIKSTNESSKSERTTYPKAGLILRTATLKDSVSSDSSTHAGLARTDSEHSLASVEDVITDSRTTDRTVTNAPVTTTTTTTDRDGRRVTTTRVREERSFLDSSTKVSGVQDIMTRMKNADIVIQEGDSTEDAEARALLNKFLGATVLMAGMQSYVNEQPTGKLVINQESTRRGGRATSERRAEVDIDQCWDERVLRKLLDECTDYDQRRRLRARIRTLMAEQEACASAVTEALAAAGEATEGDGADTREEEEVTTVTSSVRRNSSEKTVSSSTTTKTSKVTETKSAPKQVSPFAKFRQLEKQNSTNSPNSPKTPVSPGSPTPFFKFTDPALQASAMTIKERLLQWCRDKTRDYENVKLENFSTSWADGLAFCALVHHFLPTTFDYSKLVPERRRQNFTLAFKVAEEKAGIYPLLDVDDMVAMRKPDWKCVFTYVQSIHRRFKDQD